MESIMDFKIANSQEKAIFGKMTETITLGHKKIVMTSAKENAIGLGNEQGFHHIRNNIASIDKAVRRIGTQLYLLTYAASSSYYVWANIQIRKFVEHSSFPNFIDISAEVKKDCPVSQNCIDLFFKDLHPKKKGYAKVANIITRRLENDAVIARE
jgi:hypothetical protein